jgi:hypothetical protein
MTPVIESFPSRRSPVGECTLGCNARDVPGARTLRWRVSVDHGGPESGQVEGLSEKADRTQAFGDYLDRFWTEPGHHDDRQADAGVPQLREDAEPGEPRHPYVGDEDVGPGRRIANRVVEYGQRLLAIASFEDDAPIGPKGVHQGGAQFVIVVGHEHLEADFIVCPWTIHDPILLWYPHA